MPPPKPATSMHGFRELSATEPFAKVQVSPSHIRHHATTSSEKKHCAPKFSEEICHGSWAITVRLEEVLSGKQLWKPTSSMAMVCRMFLHALASHFANTHVLRRTSCSFRCIHLVRYTTADPLSNQKDKPRHSFSCSSSLPVLVQNAMPSLQNHCQDITTDACP